MKPRVMEIDGKKVLVLQEGATLEDYKKAIIANALQENKDHVVETAGKLGISKTTLYRMRGDGKGLLNG